MYLHRIRRNLFDGAEEEMGGVVKYYSSSPVSIKHRIHLNSSISSTHLNPQTVLLYINTPTYSYKNQIILTPITQQFISMFEGGSDHIKFNHYNRKFSHKSLHDLPQPSPSIFVRRSTSIVRKITSSSCHQPDSKPNPNNLNRKKWKNWCFVRI